MTSNAIPLNPIDSRFGWSKPLRLEEFKKKLEVSGAATHRVVIQGETKDIKIIRVHQNVPKYRMENGRTASAQAEYLAKHENQPKTLFSDDAELWKAQSIQHELLLKLAEKSDLRKFFEDVSNKQVDPILLDEHGYVVNGNRRLSTWRDLYFNDPSKYGHFEYIDVVVLPPVDRKAIDRLEAELQIQKDIKAKYTWDAEANMMLAKGKSANYSTKALAELYGMKEAQVKELLDMRQYADEWLKSRNKTDMWSMVSADELAFRRIVATRGDVGNAGRQQLFKEAAFVLIDSPAEVGDSLHDAIKGMAQNIDGIISKLKGVFPIEAPAPDKGTAELFGSGSAGPSMDAVDLALSKEISKEENSSKARQVIVDFIDSQKQLKRDTKSATKLLDCCAKAAACLEDGLNIGLTAETKTDGVEEQLQQIEVKLAAIRAYLSTKPC